MIEIRKDNVRTGSDQVTPLAFFNRAAFGFVGRKPNSEATRFAHFVNLDETIPEADQFRRLVSSVT